MTKPAYIKTETLESWAKQLFNGGMAPLPAEPMKRRATLAAEFTRAHLTIPGLSRRDVEKFAALGAPFQAIAEAREARVNEWLSALPPTDTLADYIPRLGMSALELQPGSRWSYSPQAGFDTLGLALGVQRFGAAG